MNPKTLELVHDHGEQAYHVAVQFTVMATHIGDTPGAEMFAECAKELLEAGYHKYPKQE